MMKLTIEIGAVIVVVFMPMQFYIVITQNFCRAISLKNNHIQIKEPFDVFFMGWFVMIYKDERNIG